MKSSYASMVKKYIKGFPSSSILVAKKLKTYSKHF
jgi:hypothetical protein